MKSLSFLMALAAWLAPPPVAAQDAPPAGMPPARVDSPASGDQAALQALQARVDALEKLAKPAEQETVRPEEEARFAELEAAAAASEHRLRLYGFFDTGLQREWLRDESQKAFYPTKALNFVLGHVNLYMDARPTPSWRVLVENRFTLWPDGAVQATGTGTTFVSTKVLDSTAPSLRDEIRWGSIVMERAQVEWTPRDWFSLQAGYFLTPWGIWNVDHGMPTLIALILPGFLVDAKVPIHQQGVMAFGSLFFLPYELGYRAYVSNGRTTGQLDFTDDKAFGGRLFLSRPGAVSFTAGLSGYWGTSESRDKQYGLDTNGNVTAQEVVNWAYTESLVGADLSVNWGALRLRTEATLRHVVYEDGKHEPMLGIPGRLAPNRNEKFVYGILAYRFAGQFEPYLYGEAYDTDQRSLYPDRFLAGSVGLNIYFNPVVQLKTQLAYCPYSNNSGNHTTIFLASRLVVVF